MKVRRGRIPTWALFAAVVACGAAPATAWAGRPHTVHLGLDGGEIIKDKGNASIPSSACFGGSGSWPAFSGSDEDRAAIIEGVVQGLAPFDITVVTEAPPPELPHDLVLVGGSAEDYGYDDIQGHTCDVDCADDWHRNVVAVFTEEIDTGVDNIVTAILHELGHAWALNHVEGGNHIMYKGLTDQVQTWSDECTPASRVWCGWVYCGHDAQDSYHELLDRFGPPSPDTAPPTIAFVSPLDGDVVVGNRVDVVVDVDDDRKGYGWAIRSPMLDEPAVAYDLGQTSISIDIPAPGTYTLEATVLDQAGKRGNAVIEIEVVETAPSDTGDDDTGVTETSGGGPMESGANDATGCGCRAGERGRGPWIGFALLALAISRRRRSRIGACPRHCSRS